MSHIVYDKEVDRRLRASPNDCRPFSLLVAERVGCSSCRHTFGHDNRSDDGTMHIGPTPIPIQVEQLEMLKSRRFTSSRGADDVVLLQIGERTPPPPGGISARGISWRYQMFLSRPVGFCWSAAAVPPAARQFPSRAWQFLWVVRRSMTKAFRARLSKLTDLLFALVSAVCLACTLATVLFRHGCARWRPLRQARQLQSRVSPRELAIGFPTRARMRLAAGLARRPDAAPGGYTDQQRVTTVVR